MFWVMDSVNKSWLNFNPRLMFKTTDSVGVYSIPLCYTDTDDFSVHEYVIMDYVFWRCDKHTKKKRKEEKRAATSGGQ